MSAEFIDGLRRHQLNRNCQWIERRTSLRNRFSTFWEKLAQQAFRKNENQMRSLLCSDRSDLQLPDVNNTIYF